MINFIVTPIDIILIIAGLLAILLFSGSVFSKKLRQKIYNIF